MRRVGGGASFVYSSDTVLQESRGDEVGKGLPRLAWGQSSLCHPTSSPARRAYNQLWLIPEIQFRTLSYFRLSTVSFFKSMLQIEINTTDRLSIYRFKYMYFNWTTLSLDNQIGNCYIQKIKLVHVPVLCADWVRH